MATATASAVRSQARRKFNMGCDTLHQDEIELGRDLYKACTMIYGKERSRRLAERSPSMLFRRMRYGRIVYRSASRPALVLVSDNSPFLHANKAPDRFILKPTSRRWSAFVSRVRDVSTLPRWADGWCASAEVLDELGYAIAESIATLLCWDIDSDDGVLYFSRGGK